MPWHKKHRQGGIKLSLVDDNGTLIFEPDLVENLEYARFNFDESLGVPIVLDDENDDWLVIQPENWLEAFPVADRMLVTLPDSEYELEYTQAHAFGLHIGRVNTMRAIVFGGDQAQAKKTTRDWFKNRLGWFDLPIRIMFENPTDHNGYGEGMAIAAVTISRAMYPTDSDMESYKEPPKHLKLPKF